MDSSSSDSDNESVTHLTPNTSNRVNSVTHLTPTTLNKSGVWDSLFLLYPLLTSLDLIDAQMDHIPTYFFPPNITTLKIPSQLISIDKEAFRSCHLLTTITITIPPASNLIGNDVFKKCKKLEKLYVNYDIEDYPHPTDIITLLMNSINACNNSKL